MTFLLVAFILLPFAAFCLAKANNEIDGAVEAIEEGDEWLTRF